VTVGLKMSKPSSAAKEILAGLTKRQRRAIRKGNPFKAERDDAIRMLKARGVKAELLAEVTGLSDSTIFRIVKTTPGPPTHRDSVNRALKSLKEAFEALYKAIALVL
jgi:DNA invertase Pin-like site-specific DNA recombinase